MGLIVWVASYPKSGNTWARLLLRALAFQRAGRALDGLLSAPASFEASDADARWFQPRLAKPIAECGLAEIAAARPGAQAAIASAGPGDRLVKTHHRLGVERGQPTINGSVTRSAIYLVRDPRDVAVSYAAYLGLGLDETIEHMLDPAALSDRMNGAYWALGAWRDHVEGWAAKAGRGVTVIRYEDLLAEPKRTFRALLAGLGLEATPGQQRRAIEACGFARLAKEEARTGFSETPGGAARFFRKGEAGAWRETLSPEQVRRLEAGCGETMARFGYAG